MTDDEAVAIYNWHRRARGLRPLDVSEWPLRLELLDAYPDPAAAEALRAMDGHEPPREPQRGRVAAVVRNLVDSFGRGAGR